MAKKQKRPQFVVGRFILDGSTITDPQTVAMAETFTRDPQAFLKSLQALQHRLTGQFEYHNTECRWNPPEPFNVATFSGDANRVYEAWNAARHENSRLGVFDGDSLRSLARLLGQMTTSGTVPENMVSAFDSFRDAVERVQLGLSLRRPSADLIHSNPQDWHTDYFQVSELAKMRKAVKLSHSSNTMTRKVKEEIGKGRIQRDGNSSMRIRLDLFQEWNTPKR